MITSVDVTCSAHVSCQLIDFIYALLHQLTYLFAVSEISHSKLLCFTVAPFWALEVGCYHVVTLVYQAVDQMGTYESATSQHQTAPAGLWTAALGQCTDQAIQLLAQWHR